MSNEIGKPVYFSTDSTKSFAPQWKLVEGSNIYRILPPFGSLASKGLWSFYNVVHWGYRASNGKMRPFTCIRKQDFKTKRIQVECPQCTDDYNREQFEKAESDKFIKMGKHKDEIKKLLEPLTDRRKLFNAERKHYLNVMRQDGSIGILKLSNNGMKALRAEIKRLVEKGEATDPIGISEGIWFDFYRTGMDKNTDIKVSPVYEIETINGRKMQAISVAPLTETVLQRMQVESRDLSDMFKTITRDQIQLLVESEGDPETVDSVFGAPTVSTNLVEPEDGDEYEPEADLVASPATVAKQISEEEELLKRLEEIKKARGTAPKAEVTKSAPAEDLSDVMDPDSFLENYRSTRAK